MLICDKCHGKIPNEAKFCPHCGDPVTEADLPAGEIVTQGAGTQAEISFGKSSAASYEQAVKICKNHPSYTETGEGRSITHQVTISISEIELVINLWDLVGKLSSARMLLNGQPATKKHLVQKSLGCFRERAKAFNQDQYCFGEEEWSANLWGCKKLGMPFRQWGGGWLSYGQIDKKGIWHFDKAKIRHELTRALHENELCPLLNPQNALATLDRIPDTINPKTDPSWEYDTFTDWEDGEHKEVAQGIRPVVKKANQYVVSSFRPQWRLELDEVMEDYHEASGSLELPEGKTKKRKKRAPKKQGPGCLKRGCFWGIGLFAAFTVLTIIVTILSD